MNISNEELKKMINTISKLDDLVEIIPEIKSLVEEKKEQEIFNQRAAKIGRNILLIAGAVGTVIGTMYAVAKLMITMGGK